jgi:potassium efflux system protein
VAGHHFRWRTETLVALRRALTNLMILFLPASFLSAMLLVLDPVGVGGALGKLLLAAALLSLAWSLYQVLHLGKGVLHGYLSQNRTGLWYRLRFLWFPLLVALPLLLTGLELAGYVYTAATLIDGSLLTLELIFALVVVKELALRWLRLTRRRLAFDAAMEKRGAARVATESGHPNTVSAAGAPMVVDEPEVDLDALSEDTHKLIGTVILLAAVAGIWWIWSPVLPAFSLLKDVSLWYHTVVVDGQEVLQPVTLASLLLAVVIVVVTIVGSKRVPAFLEIVLLQRFSMESRSRYPIVRLSGYFIAAVGALLAVNVIGANWSQLQWLVAAMGVGIGFGLQEIIANFISGLIILFEKPIGIGDIVTVGDTSGTVTRIQIRATTITTWDRKELLVPNKEFITGRLLNWSLSDPINRIVITVGVAYGSDVDLAMKLLAEVADEHEHVLQDPEPTVIFEQFADSALTLVLRCFVGTVDVLISANSDLHKSINQKFNDAGITIAFPQMDVHLNTTGPVEVQAGGPAVGKAD